VVMPGLDGVDLVREVAQVRPDLSVILMSGYARKDLQGEIREMANAYISKPFTVDELLTCVRIALSEIDMAK
ncbi:MAG: response regulator, partial [Longimicrobiales bacterium]|nr:response regulator [Longimicrobiales bacterium]